MSQQGFTQISVEQAANLIEQGATIVDVRDPMSFQQGHMPGAYRLDNQNIADFLREADPDTATIVVCYHGHASQSAAAYLSSQDFTQVYSMDGGFTHWQLLYPERVERG